MLKDSKENMYYAGRIFKLLCMDFKLLEEGLRKLEKNFNENLANAKRGYDEETRNVCKIRTVKKESYFINGNIGICNGALNSGIDIYYAYPMTPATPILSELAPVDGVKVIELENEIAVVNAG